MKKTIYKYDIVPGPMSLDLPKGAVALTVQVQNEKPKLWVLLEPDRPLERRYVATFQIRNGALVFHTFEVRGT